MSTAEFNITSHMEVDMTSGSVRNASGGDWNVETVMTVFYPRGATIFASFCAVFFTVFGFLGNLITIIALLQSYRIRQNATTAFVISLAVSDLLFCSTSLPLTASRYISEAWVLGPTLCKLFPVFFYGNVAVSLLSMMAVTVNRYILISYPDLYDKLYTGRYIALMLIFIWSFSFSIMAPPLFEVWGRLGLDPPTFSCTILKKDGSSPKKFLFMLGFLLPCVVIILSYSCIYWKVHQSRSKFTANSPTSSPSNRPQYFQRRNDHRLTTLMMFIFICFLLCFLPLMLVNVLEEEIKYPTLHVLASVMAWASSVINPFIYAFSNMQYRSAYIKLFLRTRKLTRRGTGPCPHSPSNSGSGRTTMTEMLHFNVRTEKMVIRSHGHRYENETL